MTTIILTLFLLLAADESAKGPGVKSLRKATADATCAQKREVLLRRFPSGGEKGTVQLPQENTETFKKAMKEQFPECEGKK